MTQHDLLVAALAHHGCKQLESSTRWEKWTTGDLANQITPNANKFFFVGTTGFRYGTSRTNSADWPKTRARLIAEAMPHAHRGKVV